MKIIESGQYMLFLSVFYSEKGWNQLLRMCIAPILNYIYDSWNCNYVIHFSEQRGDCISFTITANAANRNEIRDYIYNHIKGFLDCYPSKQNVSNEVKLFADFENNSIHFKLHNFFPALKSVDSFICPYLWHEITEIFILDALDFDVSIDSLHSFSFHLTLLLIMSDTEIRNLFCANMKVVAEQLTGENDLHQQYVNNQLHFKKIKANCEKILKRQIEMDEHNIYQMYRCFNKFLNSNILNHLDVPNSKYLLFTYILQNIRKVFCIEAKTAYIVDYTLYMTLIN